MVKVRFFGLLRLTLAESAVYLEASNVQELLKQIDSHYEKINMEQLRNSIIFVNGKNITQLKLYRTSLKDGDEVMFLSPVSGG